jgi:hypothetical protein
MNDIGSPPAPESGPPKAQFDNDGAISSGIAGSLVTVWWQSPVAVRTPGYRTADWPGCNVWPGGIDRRT